MIKPTGKKPGKIRAAIVSWLGGEITDSQFFLGQPSASTAGQTVTESTVLQLSTVWACVRLISETIATLPLSIYERVPGGRVAATEHPLYSIIHSTPNRDTTAAVLWEAFVASMLLQGNGFAEKKYVGQKLAALEFLSPRRLSITRDPAGRPEYRYAQRDHTQRVIPASSVFRVPGFTVDGSWGLSGIQYGSMVFGSALAAQSAANSTFEHGLMPTVAFTLERVLTPKQREEFRATLNELKGALNAGESPLLEAGMGIESVGVNPRDAQLLESRNHSVEEIARWFRVWPGMIGHQNAGQSMFGSGYEQGVLTFLTFTLRPWLTRIEQWINKDLLSPADQQRFYAEFNVEGLLRADSEARAKFYALMIANSMMTADEGRQKENMPPMGGNAGVLLAQGAMMPLDKLGVVNE